MASLAARSSAAHGLIQHGKTFCGSAISPGYVAIFSETASSSPRPATLPWPLKPFTRKRMQRGRFQRVLLSQNSLQTTQCVIPPYAYFGHKQRYQDPVVFAALFQHKETWHEFTVSTITKDSSIEKHCRGLVSVANQTLPRPPVSAADIAPLQHPVPGAVWYKAMRRVAYHFGPAFQPCQEIEAKANSRQCKALVRLQAPESRYPQSQYAMHLAAIKGCLQIATVALNRGHHSAVNALMPPALIGDLVIFPRNVASSDDAIVASEAVWSGVGRPDDNKRYVSDIRTIAQESNGLVLHLEGLRYHTINASADRPHAFTQLV
ncbi:polyketide synthase dehydratase-domain-containing protein [Aspergillus foveolatus]|uniref:polyketide synthase dehydratase-domain-containing protein n=1 Tax=Aspergillus foveolatus TaxID=210207 RepID=UPI003CCC9525